MSSPPPLNLDNVQGDILMGGLPKMNETFFLFTINDAKTFCQRLPQVADALSHTLHTTQARDNISTSKGNSSNGIVPTAGANIAFSFAGLQKMSPSLQNLDLNMGDQAFTSGMKAGAVNTLHDPAQPGSSDPVWETPYLSPQNIHGILLVAGSDPNTCSTKLQSIKSIWGSSVSEVTTISGKVRPGAMKGHEHFGFDDGVSQPAVQDVDTSVPPGQDTIPQGIILCGRSGDFEQRPDWMLDGSFLCFRKLRQNVPEWNQFLVQASNQLGTWSDQLGSRLVGRWKSGCPVELSPDFDDVNIGNDPSRVNNFSFDSHNNFKCPMGAHIRKTNPRNDLGRQTVNQFRILRRGIPYGEELDVDPNGERGLLFVCYQSNISTGFQFLQQTWANAPSFSTQGAGLDAIIGQDNNDKTVTMNGLFPQDPTRSFELSGINRFVVPKGGEYFFSPSMTALRNTLANVKQELK